MREPFRILTEKYVDWCGPGVIVTTKTFREWLRMVRGYKGKCGKGRLARLLDGCEYCVPLQKSSRGLRQWKTIA